MKKLLITSTDMMMIQFLIPHVRYLSENGFRVEIACSVVGQRLEDVKKALADVPCVIHTVRLERSPAKLKNLSGYRDMKCLLKENRYDLIWTNEPVMGVVTRLAARNARKQGTKVLYMCHGFHFYKGAPLLNWMIYYPVERLMSRFCDAIVTINREDEARAKTLHCPRVERINGIGVDMDRLCSRMEQTDIRRELGLTEQNFLVLSVGELNRNKNQQVIMRALQMLNDRQIHYLLCGWGEELEHLQQLAREMNLEENVHFLGYRKDVPDILRSVDIFAHPSKREGLGLACLEAMTFGLPLVTSNIQGIADYVDNGVTGYSCAPEDAAAFAQHLKLLCADEQLRKQIGQTNIQKVRKYAMDVVQEQIFDIMMK